MSTDYRYRTPSHEIAARWEIIVARGNAEMARYAGEQLIRTGDGRIISGAARRAELAAGDNGRPVSIARIPNAGGVS